MSHLIDKPVLKVWTHGHHNVISLKMFSLIFSSCLESSDDVINIVIIQPWIIHDWIISFTNPIVTESIWWIISMFIQTSKKWSRIEISYDWFSEWFWLDGAVISQWESDPLSCLKPTWFNTLPDKFHGTVCLSIIFVLIICSTEK